MPILVGELCRLGASPGKANGQMATPLHLALGAVYDGSVATKLLEEP